MPKVKARSTIYRPDVVKALADELNITKTLAGAAFDAMLGYIDREVFQRGNRIVLKGFGSFFLCSYMLNKKKTVRLSFKASTLTKRHVASKAAKEEK